MVTLDTVKSLLLGKHSASRFLLETQVVYVDDQAKQRSDNRFTSVAAAAGIQVSDDLFIG